MQRSIERGYIPLYEVDHASSKESYENGCKGLQDLDDKK